MRRTLRSICTHQCQPAQVLQGRRQNFMRPDLTGTALKSIRERARSLRLYDDLAAKSECEGLFHRSSESAV